MNSNQAAQSALCLVVDAPPKPRRPQSIKIEFCLDDAEMARPSDVAFLLERLAHAFDGNSWPVFDALYDSRGNRIGTIHFQYVVTGKKTG